MELPVQSQKMDPSEMRGRIAALEAIILSHPQVEVPIEHHHAPGIYLRQMTVKAGTILTGKIHKTEHLCILAKGSVTVANEHGSKTITAPAIIHSSPGTKRAIHALEDSVWINVHHNPTNEQDEDKIEDLYVVDSYEQYLDFMEKKQIVGGN